MTQLDVTYRAQRLRLRAAALALAARVWAGASTQRQDEFVDQILAAVAAGQAQVVRLVDAYMATKTLQATGRGEVRGLNPDDYRTEQLRRASADEVYKRPFGAVGYTLEKGGDFAAARVAGGALLDKLVSTDLQLAQTYSARDWMREEETIVGYERVAGLRACELCAAAATRLYHSEDLMPIHEHCSCDVVPVYGDRPVRQEPIPDGVVFVHDSELGPRLVDETWAAAA